MKLLKKLLLIIVVFYFGAIGGAGAMMSSCIEECEIIAFDDLGPEAIRKLKVKKYATCCRDRSFRK